MRIRILLAVAVVIIVVTTGGWIRTRQTLQRVQIKLDALQQASSTPEGTVTALFVQSDRVHITYRVPHQTMVNGTAFVNYTEQTAEITGVTDIFGLSVRDPLDALSHIAVGHQISIKVVGNTNSFIAQAIYVSP